MDWKKKWKEQFISEDNSNDGVVFYKLNTDNPNKIEAFIQSLLEDLAKEMITKDKPTTGDDFYNQESATFFYNEGYNKKNAHDKATASKWGIKL